MYRAGEQKNLDYILAIVNSGPTYAIFVIKLSNFPATVLSDLTIDCVFSVDDDFVFEVGQYPNIHYLRIELCNFFTLRLWKWHFNVSTPTIES